MTSIASGTIVKGRIRPVDENFNAVQPTDLGETPNPNPMDAIVVVDDTILPSPDYVLGDWQASLGIYFTFTPPTPFLGGEFVEIYQPVTIEGVLKMFYFSARVVNQKILVSPVSGMLPGSTSPPYPIPLYANTQEDRVHIVTLYDPLTKEPITEDMETWRPLYVSIEDSIGASRLFVPDSEIAVDGSSFVFEASQEAHQVRMTGRWSLRSVSGNLTRAKGPYYVETTAYVTTTTTEGG